MFVRNVGHLVSYSVSQDGVIHGRVGICKVFFKENPSKSKWKQRRTTAPQFIKSSLSLSRLTSNNMKSCTIALRFTITLHLLCPHLPSPTISPLPLPLLRKEGEEREKKKTE